MALVPRLRAGQIPWRIGALFGAAGAVTAFAGAAVNRLLPDGVVLGLFAALMIAAGIADAARAADTVARPAPPTAAR